MTASSSSFISEELGCTSCAQVPCMKTRWTFIINYTIRPCCRELTKSEKPERTFLSTSCFVPLSKYSSSLITVAWKDMDSFHTAVHTTWINIHVFDKEQYLATDYTIHLEHKTWRSQEKKNFSPARAKDLGPEGAKWLWLGPIHPQSCPQ